MTFRQSEARLGENQFYPRHITTTTDLYAFMNHAVSLGTSDLVLQTHEPAIAMIHGEPLQITRFRLQPSQIDAISSLILSNQDIKSTLAGGRDYDHAFEIPDENEKDEHGVAKRHRFRLNATAIGGRGSESKQLVMRHIPADPPTLEAIGFPEELLGAFALEQGMFVIAGETGSGKTTTFAACIRYILEGKTPIKGNILTYEKPIEYVYNGIESEECVIAQTEIGVHLATFDAGVVNSLRRKPSLIVVGEMRDKETIAAANQVSITGHPLYGTVHANDSALVIRRMVMEYDFHKQAQAYAELVGNMRLIMSQTLAPGKNGGRYCLRDWVVIDPERSEELLDVGPMKSVQLIRSWQRAGDRGRTMKFSIKEAWQNDKITEETAVRWLNRYGHSREELRDDKS